MVKVMGLIPARGGSTRVKNKNIRDLNGDPLIAWTIYDLLDAKEVDKVYVSTDSKEIAKVAEDYGAEVIDRPKMFSTPWCQLESAILHAYYTVGKDYQFILTCQPTTPFRHETQIDEGIKKAKHKWYDSLIYMCNASRFMWNKVNMIPFNYDYTNRVRSQDKSWEGIEIGDYVTRTTSLIEYGNRICGNMAYSYASNLSYYDVDTETDLKIVNGIAKELDLHAKN